MGYKREKKVYKLKFEDAQYDGLEVKVKSLTMGELVGFTKLLEIKNNKADSEESLDAFDQLLENFSKSLVSWNLEDEDDTPVPTTKEGLMSQDPEFIFYVIESWLEAVAGVPTPLSRPSENGKPSLVASIPMETL